MSPNREWSLHVLRNLRIHSISRARSRVQSTLAQNHPANQREQQRLRLAVTHGLTHLHIVHTLSQGKALMAELAEGFILLPGGPGSLDEFFEMLTWAQLGYHQKPIGILNVAGYYDLMIELLKQMVVEGFFKQEYFQRIHIARSAEELLTKMHSK